MILSNNVEVSGTEEETKGEEMTLNDCVIKAPLTGECEIDLDIAEKYFNKKSSISEYDGSYRLFRYTHKKHYVLKVTISKADAMDLIDRLKLVRFPCGLFVKSAIWRW